MKFKLSEGFFDNAEPTSDIIFEDDFYKVFSPSSWDNFIYFLHFGTFGTSIDPYDIPIQDIDGDEIDDQYSDVYFVVNKNNESQIYKIDTVKNTIVNTKGEKVDSIFSTLTDKKLLDFLNSTLKIADNTLKIRNNILFSVSANVINLKVPREVTVIRNESLSQCKSLKVIYIPYNVEHISNHAFSNCGSLTDIYYEGSEEDWHDIISDYSIPNSVKLHFNIKINENYYKGDSKMKFKMVNESFIENRFFDYYSGTYESMYYALINSYYDQSEVTRFIIRNGVRKIGKWSFSNWTALESIKIPNSVTEIESGAFRRCTSLKSIHIPNSVTIIGTEGDIQGTFEECTALESIDLPDRLEVLWNCTFKGCTSLKTVNIPDSLTKIGYNVFEDCPNLTLHFSSKNTLMKEYAIENHIPYKIDENCQDIQTEGFINKLKYKKEFDDENLLNHFDKVCDICDDFGVTINRITVDDAYNSYVLYTDWNENNETQKILKEIKSLTGEKFEGISSIINTINNPSREMSQYVSRLKVKLNLLYTRLKAQRDALVNEIKKINIDKKSLKVTTQRIEWDSSDFWFSAKLGITVRVEKTKNEGFLHDLKNKKTAKRYGANFASDNELEHFERVKDICEKGGFVVKSVVDKEGPSKNYEVYEVELDPKNTSEVITVLKKFTSETGKKDSTLGDIIEYIRDNDGSMMDIVYQNHAQKLQQKIKQLMSQIENIEFESDNVYISTVNVEYDQDESSMGNLIFATIKIEKSIV